MRMHTITYYMSPFCVLLCSDAFFSFRAIFDFINSLLLFNNVCVFSQGYRIPEDDLQSLVGSSSEPTLDYRDFAANVVALTDPETHAKEVSER